MTAAVLVLATLRSGAAASRPLRRSRRRRDLAIYPVLAIVAFFFHSWFTTGRLVRDGRFFVPDNVATGNLWTALDGRRLRHAHAHRHAIRLAGARGRAAVLARGLSRAEHAASLVVLALVALMALPAYAFFSGHPFRMRYMVAPSVGAAVFAGIALRHAERPLAPRARSLRLPCGSSRR